MSPNELNTLWEKLEGLRQSYTFRPVAIKDINGSDTRLDRIINKYEIEWDNWFTESPSTTIPNDLLEHYAFVNKALSDAIRDYSIGNESRTITSRETIDILGKKPLPVIVKLPPKKKSNAPLIAAAVIGIIGSIGFLRHKRLI